MSGASVDRLRGHAELPVVEVLAVLLAICRDHFGELDAALQVRTLDQLDREPHRDHATAILELEAEPIDPEFLDQRVLAALAGFLAGADDPTDLALRARDAATVLDEHRGPHLFAWFAGARRVRRADDPVPITPTEVAAEELGTTTGLAPSPDALAAPPPARVPLDGTSRLRLCPRDLGPLTLIFDARFHAAIDGLFGTVPRALGPDVVWAAVTPTTAWLSVFEFDRVGASPPGFTNVRMRAAHADSYRARALAGLDAVRDQGAAIIVMPELSVDAALEDLLGAWFATSPSVAILLAGSRHVTGDAAHPVNRARLFIRGLAPSERLHHDKFAGFALADGAVEMIQRPNQVTIYGGRRWSVAPLICRDFLTLDARALLIRTRVRAVLVAALSPKTDVFAQDAAALASDGQCLTFIANTPMVAGDHAAIFARPLRSSGALAGHSPPDGTPGTSAYISTNGLSFKHLTIP